MKPAYLTLLLIALVLGCTRSVSYQNGKKMADATYGALAPAEMTQQINTILQRVKAEVEQAKNKQDWWKGFCDRGEEIWLARIDQINEAMGQKMFDRNRIKSMFRQMRSSFRG